MFNVNDLVICNKEHMYLVTGTHALCKVIRLNCSNDQFVVKVVGIDPLALERHRLNTTYAVSKAPFSLCTVEEFKKRYPTAIILEEEVSTMEKENNAMDRTDTYEVTEEEKDQLVEEMYDLLKNNYDCYKNVQKDALKTIVNKWAREKGWLIQLFKKHPNYNGNYQILFDHDYEREIDRSIINEFFSWLCREAPKYAEEYKVDDVPFSVFDETIFKPEYRIWTGVNYILREDAEADIIVNGRKPDEINEAFGKLEAKRNKVLGECANFPGRSDFKVAKDSIALSFINLINRLSGNVEEQMASDWIADEVNKYFPEAKVVAGQKTSRIVNKFCTLYGINKHPDYNKKFAAFADAINPMLIKRHTVLSVHPIDYLLMSNGNSWHSCHAIDLDAYSGEYSSGTMSYMLDPSTVEFYTVDKSQDSNHIELKEKLQRCMFHIGEDKVIQGRVYPQGNDGATKVYKNIREIVQKVIADCLDVPNLWKNVKGTQICSEMIQTRGTHYPDYIYTNGCNVSFLTGEDDAKNRMPIIVGANPICIVCGYEHRDSHIYDDDCERKARGIYHCTECGCSIDEDEEEIYWIDGEPYCEDCVFYCDYHEEYEVEARENVITLANGHMVCETGFEHGDYATCTHCGEAYNCDDTDEIATEDGNWFCCEECADAEGYVFVEEYGWIEKDSANYCPFCDKWVAEEDWNEEHECCNDCAEEHEYEEVANG